MTNLYEVLNVARGASPDVIDAAYLALRRSYSDATDVSMREQIEAAYEILGNSARRTAYDASLDVVITPPPIVETPVLESIAESPADRPADTDDAVVEAPVAVEVAVPGEPVPEQAVSLPDETRGPIALAPAPVKSGSRGMMAALIGMVVVLVAGVAAVAGFLLLRSDDGSSYPLSLDDAAYDLTAMGLVVEDLPNGFELANEQDFDNEAWAAALDQEDPEAKQRQLEALGRVRNYVRFFQVADPITHLGHPFQYASQSSLFVDENAAIESMKTQCDLPYDQTVSIKDVRIKKSADQSTSFLVTTPTDELGNTVDTVVCFRTGRIVHSIAQRGLEGTEDLGLTIRLANIMLERVDAALGDGG